MGVGGRGAVRRVRVCGVNASGHKTHPQTQTPTLSPSPRRGGKEKEESHAKLSYLVGPFPGAVPERMRPNPVRFAGSRTTDGVKPDYCLAYDLGQRERPGDGRAG